MIGFDLERNSVVIQDDGAGLVIDLGPIHDFAAWAPKVKDLIMVAGDLVISDNVSPVPPLPI